MQEEPDIEIIEDEKEPEQTTLAPTPEPEAKTKLQQFIDRLSAYPDKETAKIHIIDIAKDLDCAKSLGYKALKRVEKFKPVGIEAREPTAKIATPDEIVVEEEPAPETVTAKGEETIEQPALEPSSTVDKITPIFERSVGRLFNRGLELVSGNKETLTNEEARDTATLLPIMIYRFTRMKLNEDQMIDATCITHFGAIALRVINTKVTEWRVKEKEKKIITESAPKQAPTPADRSSPESEKRTETELRHEPTDAELEQKKRSQPEPSFMKHLA